jgi:hypothetical protein
MWKAKETIGKEEYATPQEPTTKEVVVEAIPT